MLRLATPALDMVSGSHLVLRFLPTVTPFSAFDALVSPCGVPVSGFMLNEAVRSLLVHQYWFAVSQLVL